MRWRKSSYSTNGGDCVEVADWYKSSYSSPDGPQCVEVSGWHKSNYSTNSGECVEVAEGQSVLVRDTQNRELGHLTFTAPAWTGLLNTLKAR